MKPLSGADYAVHRCARHRKTIHYLKASPPQERCWDCAWEARYPEKRSTAEPTREPTRRSA